MRAVRRIALALVMWSATPASAGMYFEAPTTLDVGITSMDVVTDGAGNWLAAWFKLADQQVFVARSTDGGRTWSAPAAVATLGVGDFAWTIAAGSAGVFVVVFEDGTELSAVRSADGGMTWSSPATVVTGASGPFARLRSDGAGTWVLTTVPGVAPCEIEVIVSSDDGVTWGAPTLLAIAPGAFCGPFLPSVDGDGSGVWVAAWTSTDTLGGTVGSDPDVHTSRSIDGGTTWSSPAALNTNAATDASSDDETPVLATNRAGRWIAVWNSEDSLGGTLSAGEHVLFSHSTDAGASWTPPSAMNPRAATEGENETPTALVPDGLGAWVATRNRVGLTVVTVSRSIDDGATWTVPSFLHGSMEPDTFVREALGGLATDGLGTWLAGVRRSDTEESATVLVGSTLCTGPSPGCRVPIAAAKSKVAFADKLPNSRDGMKWKWLVGEATSLADFGDPLSTTAYTVCVYDADGRVLVGSRAPPGGTCDGQPCWRSTATGFVLKTKAPSDSPFGLSKLKLKAGDTGRAKIALGARGVSFAVPVLGSSALPLTVQLETSDTGTCWEATFSSVLQETATKLKAKSD